ncbi:type II toxin-antitoxin system PemK/MazF family toxin [Nitrosomonas aestuarii]|uniref:type II toxin-antitoxin system PemK/MazF family toxin n=1 Tax=Nitrosomonas aestuarii TaxID=52441 RepID=UPI000D31EE87|nr:type II toxin-antitoxin system PemK/MazF family toxin [Nitrosomonas aestuarii]PTN07655.1 mRNA interferase MazF [Nitrosomonas aestuarii]
MTKHSIIIPKRGEIWWINFDPSIGGEIKKTRPAVIVSNNVANKVLNRIQVIPLTSIVKNVYPAECLIIIQNKHSKAMADQLTTISKLRLSTRIGTVTAHEMDEIARIIRLQLGM